MLMRQAHTYLTASLQVTHICPQTKLGNVQMTAGNLEMTAESLQIYPCSTAGHLFCMCAS